MKAARGGSTSLALGVLLLGAVCSQAPAEARPRGRAHHRDASAGSSRPGERPAHAAGHAKGPHKSACVEAYNEATQRMLAAHLREARALAGQCSARTCGRALRQECVLLYTRLEADIPTIVPVVADEGDALGTDVEVRMDGEILTSKLDGLAIPVDPGLHRLTFTTASGVVASQETMIVEGQHNRPVAVPSPQKKVPRPMAKASLGKSAEQEPPRRPIVSTPAAERSTADEEREPTSERSLDAPQPRAADSSILLRSTPAREAPAEDRTTWPVYTFGTVGLLGVGGYAALTWKGRQDNDTLVQSCKPDCNPASVHHIRMVYLAADASLGVGILALTAATWSYFHSRGREDTVPRATARLSSFDVQAASTGAVATVGGHF